MVRPTKSADPSSEMSDEPREAQESIITQIAPRTGTYRVPASLWKRVDGYYDVDDPEDRYDPNKIKGYKIAQNKAWSVDESRCQDVWDDVDQVWRKKCCGPPNEDPRFEPPEPSDYCRSTLPQHSTQQIGVIELKPTTVEVEELREVHGFQGAHEELSRNPK